MESCLLGQGTSGQVVLHERDGSRVAIKKIRLQKEHGLAIDAIREARILTQLDHPRVVRLHSVQRHDDHLCLEMEFLPMSLRDVLREPLTESATVSFARDLFSAIDYCHSQSIMHRDIKPENLLLGHDGKLKLVDFGLARETLNLATPNERASYTSQMVTLWYRAPEILLAQPYGPAVDIWSAGCVVVEMLTGAPLFKATTELEALQLILRDNPGSMQAHETCLLPVKPVEIRRLIAACLDHPERRITAKNALILPWAASAIKKRPRTTLTDN